MTNLNDTFNRLFSEWHSGLARSSFPPYNIRKLSEGKYTIELAIAGLTISDITIEMIGNKLIIKSTNNNKTEENNYIFRGIANRAFTRTFTLMDGIEVSNAEFINGILTVYLDALVPKQKTIKINIAQPKASDTQLLNEDSVI